MVYDHSFPWSLGSPLQLGLLYQLSDTWGSAGHQPTTKDAGSGFRAMLGSSVPTSSMPVLPEEQTLSFGCVWLSFFFFFNRMENIHSSKPEVLRAMEPNKVYVPEELYLGERWLLWCLVGVNPLGQFPSTAIQTQWGGMTHLATYFDAAHKSLRVLQPFFFFFFYQRWLNLAKKFKCDWLYLVDLQTELTRISTDAWGSKLERKKKVFFIFIKIHLGTGFEQLSRQINWRQKAKIACRRENDCELPESSNCNRMLLFVIKRLMAVLVVIRQHIINFCYIAYF